MNRQTFNNLLLTHSLTYPTFLSLIGAHESLSEEDRQVLLESSKSPQEIVRTLKKKEGYRSFTFFATAQDFSKWFNNQEYALVQLYDMTPIRSGDIVGFAGTFRWTDNTITSLDGDSYSSPVIWGYREFEEKGRKCLDILAEEW